MLPCLFKEQQDRCALRACLVIVAAWLMLRDVVEGGGYQSQVARPRVLAGPSGSNSPPSFMVNPVAFSQPNASAATGPSLGCPGFLLSAARSNGNYTVYLGLINATGLNVQFLGLNDRVFTLLLPSDEAFSRMDPHTKAKVFNDSGILRNVLSYHIVDGVWPSGDLLSKDHVDMHSLLQGLNLPMDNNNGRLHAGYNSRPPAYVVNPDLVISPNQCVVHGLDEVLLPPVYFPEEVVVVSPPSSSSTNVVLIVLVIVLPTLAMATIVVFLFVIYTRRKYKFKARQLALKDELNKVTIFPAATVAPAFESQNSGESKGSFAAEQQFSGKEPFLSWGQSPAGPEGGVPSWGVTEGGGEKGPPDGPKGEFEDVEVATGDMWKSFVSNSWMENSKTPSKDGSSEKLSNSSYERPGSVVDARILLSEMRLRPEDYIGGGSFGRVYRWQHLGTYYAVKVLVGRKDTLQELWHEVQLIRELRHPNVLQFMFALANPPSEVYIVTEYMPRGSLFHLLHESAEEVPLPQKLHMALDVAKGMAFLHSLNIVHRDLKSANLLVQNDGTIKVCDFGQARNVLGTRLETCNRAGTAPYTSPEAFQDFQRTPKQADLYSFGIILWELMARKQPWEGLNEYHLMKAVVIEDRRPELGADWHPGIVDLIQRCWLRDPLARPSFEDCVKMLLALSAEIQ